MRKPIHILFVEDDPEMLAVYRENFLPPEFDSTTLTNGRQALALLAGDNVHFQVLVIDNRMPEMDGMDLLRIIHGKFPCMKVIVVTGYGNWSDYIDAHNLGVLRFFDKPVKMSALKELIRSQFGENLSDAKGA